MLLLLLVAAGETVLGLTEIVLLSCLIDLVELFKKLLLNTILLPELLLLLFNEANLL